MHQDAQNTGSQDWPHVLASKQHGTLDVLVASTRARRRGMGDRTTCYITLHMEHLERAKELIGDWAYTNDVEGHDNFVEVVIEEANYGGIDELHRLVDAGIPFFGKHHHGHEYTAHAFAYFDGGKDGLIWVEINSYGHPTVSFLPNHRFDQKMIKDCGQYYSIREKVLGIE